MPSLTFALLKMQKPALSLKQFMLRSEVIKMYRGFMRLRRLMDPPPGYQTPSSTSAGNASNSSNLHPLQLEWMDWVRSEFRLRQSSTDEEAIRMALAHGKRQLQEMERTILLARNKNSSSSISSSMTNNAKSGCKTNK